MKAKLTEREQILSKFPDISLYSEGSEVQNSISGVKCYLNAEALSLYKYLMEWYSIYKRATSAKLSRQAASKFNKASTLFRILYPNAYYNLVD